MTLIGLLLLSGSPSMEAAQTAYVRCLAAESDAALRRRVPPAEFAEGVALICEGETAAYRAAAMPLLLSQATAEDDLPAQEQADNRFTAMDEATRQKMIATYVSKLRARRGIRPADM